MKRLILILTLACVPMLYADPPGPTDQVVHSAAYEASHIIKMGAGRLISLIGYNSGGAQFIQVHDANTVVANGAVPVYTFTVAATSNFSLDIPISGAPMATGVMVCNSTTGPTKTIGASDCFFTVVVSGK